ncbi:hypothetical protein D8X55_00655 [Malacoplasma penetrans]|uniref:hypothetical protein n=1 Tax=Malacoplasma penetrans TaxID=28227 RepID=UPI0010101489|nr:hypothetical protein [Malacoplasma penetrans]RXY97197.1 hypothetical protein D8X55_00655 [Malacoplasma penetrans]
MKFKNLLVSEDNQLVLSDYGLTEDEVEVLDLNKSLADVVEDQELQQFIVESSIDPQKIYIYCVKEDFGNNDQLLEDIPNIKVLGKALKKLFKKLPNIYFFVYNVYLKNEDVINPELAPLEASEVEANEVSYEPVTEEEMVYEEQPVAEEEYEVVNEDLPQYEEVAASNEEFLPQEEAIVSNENLPSQEEVLVFNDDLPPYEEAVVSNEDLPMQEEVVNELPENDQLPDYPQQDNVEVVGPESFDDSVTNFVSEDGMNQPEYVQDEDKLAVETVGEAIEAYEEVQPEEVVESNELPVEEKDFNLEQQEAYAQSFDAEELESIVDDGMDDWANSDDEQVKQYILENNDIQAESTEPAELFNEPEMLLDQSLPTNEVAISDSIEEVAAENNLAQETGESTVVYDDGESSLEMPATFFDTENEEEITYEDYNEFVNDYELNIHALKSIYDFIWRILVLNNYNLKLNDLLYIAVNNLDAFSIGQSDFVRQTANKAESLFDLILQLDIKLEFNNSLFYIYLAEFFKINGNKIVVNEKFLDTISIWVNKNSKEKFIAQIEQFMNYSTIYNKKIVFSYFIELANYVKGRLPSINSNITLIDVHRLLNNPYNKVRKENIFGFMVQKINQILEANGVVIEMYLVKTPDSMFGVEINQPSELASESWKTQLALLYKKLIQNIHDYILLKGNREVEIFNIFLDIRDLRMYQDVAENRNVLSPETISVAANNNDVNFLTIGDELSRNDSIVPSQNNNGNQYSYINPTNYVQNLERGIPMERKFGNLNNNVVNNTSDNLMFPNETTVNTSSEDALREKYASKFNVAEFESSMSRRIEEYERKIKNNISRIEAERKQLREKMEELKNI